MQLRTPVEYNLGVNVNPETCETVFTADVDGNPTYREFSSDDFKELLERRFAELAGRMIMPGANSVKLYRDVFRASYGNYYFPALQETEKEREKSESIGYDAEVFYRFDGNDIIARTMLSPMSPATTLLTDCLSLLFPSSPSFGYPIVTKLGSSAYKMRPLLVAPVDELHTVIGKAAEVFDSMGGAIGYGKGYLELEKEKSKKISKEEKYRNLRIANIMKLLGRDVSLIETRPVVTKAEEKK
jgi:hypothetical protein